MTKRKPTSTATTASASDLNNFFHSVVHDPGASYDVPFGPSPADGITSFESVSAEDVEFELRRLKNGKSPGPDELPPWLLKAFATTLAPSLATIFSRSLATGVFPASFKLANVTPIVKDRKRGSSDLGNHGPISLTSVLAKVLENIVLRQANECFQQDLHDHQFGFRAHRSVTHLLTVAINDWATTKARGNAIAVVFLDIRDAFDKVRRQILLTCLMRLVCLLPSRRQQRVVVGSDASPPIASLVWCASR